jgi:ABC-2 type transport system permease protein
MRSTKALLATEAKLLLREPAAIFWGIVFTLVLTVAFGLATSGSHPDPKLGGLRIVDVYVPTMMAFVLTVLSLQALPAAFASYREKGVLRRMSTTPVSPIRLLGADIAVNVMVIAIALALIALTARIAFNVTLPRQGLGFVVALALGALATMGLGAIIASIAWSTRAAGAIGALMFFPLMFFAGLWVPRQSMSHGLRQVGDYTPLGATVAAVQDTMAGHWPRAGHLEVLAAYAIVLAVAAARLFRWE